MTDTSPICQGCDNLSKSLNEQGHCQECYYERVAGLISMCGAIQAIRVLHDEGGGASHEDLAILVARIESELTEDESPSCPECNGLGKFGGCRECGYYDHR